MKASLTPLQVQRLERALRTIRQRIFDMPDAKAERAGLAIEVIKSRLMPTWQDQLTNRQCSHWMYACE